MTGTPSLVCMSTHKSEKQREWVARSQANSPSASLWHTTASLEPQQFWQKSSLVRKKNPPNWHSQEYHSKSETAFSSYKDYSSYLPRGNDPIVFPFDVKARHPWNPAALQTQTFSFQKHCLWLYFKQYLHNAGSWGLRPSTKTMFIWNHYDHFIRHIPLKGLLISKFSKDSAESHKIESPWKLCHIPYVRRNPSHMTVTITCFLWMSLLHHLLWLCDSVDSLRYAATPWFAVTP